METIATMLTTVVAAVVVMAYLERKIAGLRVDVKADIKRVDDRIDRFETRVDDRFDRMEGRIQGLDDRLYSLATGMKPLIDQAQHQDTA